MSTYSAIHNGGGYGLACDGRLGKEQASVTPAPPVTGHKA